MGSRVVAKQEALTKIGGISFQNYGSHSECYTFLPYMTVACALGMKKSEIDLFLEKLDEGI